MVACLFHGGPAQAGLATCFDLHVRAVFVADVHASHAVEEGPLGEVGREGFAWACKAGARRPGQAALPRRPGPHSRRSFRSIRAGIVWRCWTWFPSLFTGPAGASWGRRKIERTLDALQELPEIGTGGPVGYYGLNMGTAIGILLTAAEPRITAAVFGLFWPDPLAETAKQITIPIQYDLQWDDEHIPREAGLALFDAFASKEKTLHANAGSHKELPRFEADGAAHFFARHLVTSPA